MSDRRRFVWVPAWLVAGLAVLPLVALLVGLAIGYGVGVPIGAARQASALAVERAGDLVHERLRWLDEAARVRAIRREHDAQ